VKNRINLKTLFSAFLLALLFTLPALCFAQGDQTSITVKVTSSGATTGAWLHLPDDYSTTKENYPLIIFIHGVGEGGSDVNAVLRQGLPKLIANGAKMNFTVGGKLFKFIVISPQFYGGWANEAMIQSVLDDMKARYRVDASRVYLTGLSAGGYGTWNYVASGKQYADNIAAIVPVSPAAIDVNKLNNFCNTVVAAKVPVWSFAGGGSGDASFLNNMQKFEQQYNSCNPAVKAISTVVPGSGHEAATWDKAYDATHTYQNPNIYEWMLQYSKGGTTTPPANAAPVANAGQNATITLPVASISLDGSASTDADGTIAAYKWTQISGPSTGVFTAATAAKTTVNALVAGSYVFELTVTDDKGATASARVTITVNAAAAIPPPVVTLANSNISVTAPTSSVVLDGSASSAPNSTIASYKWEKISGPAAGALVTSNAAKATVNSLVEGNYVFKLTVTNAAGESSAANANVSVQAAPGGTPQDCNCKHVIKPGPDGGIYSNGLLQNVQPGDTICIPAGNYPYIQFFNYVGSKEKPLVFINCGGQVKVGDGGNYGLIFNQSKFFKVTGSGSADKYGFYIDGVSKPLSSGLAMGKGCTNYEAERIEIARASAGVLAKINPDCDPINQYPNFEIRDLSFHDLYVHDIVGEGLYIGNTLPNGADITCADGSVIRALPPRIYNVKIYNVITRNTGWDGIQVASAPQGVEIYNNEVYNFGMENKGSQQAGIIMGGESQGVIYNNKIIKGTGNAIEVFGTGLTKVYNNIMSDAGWDGTTGGQDAIFIDDRPTKNNYTPLQVHLFNNTIVNSKRNGIMILTTYGTVGTNNLVYNNLIVGVGSTAEGDRAYVNIMKGVDFKTSNNLYLSSLTAAGFKDLAQKDFHLAAGSPAIDKGMDLKAQGVTFDFDGDGRPFGSAFDIGADEYTGGVVTNKPPVAKAGNDVTITLPVNTVQLDGSASTDADGTIKSYSWAKLSGPAATIATATAARTAVSALVAGTYVFELTVTDDKGATAKDQITVKVNAAVNKPPVANAGDDITITLPISTVQLDGAASSDPDGDIKSYSWAKISGPAATIATPDAVSTAVNGLVAGTYVFELTVTDNSNATAKSSVTITVNAAANKPPVANAGKAQIVQLPTNSVQVDGSASTDPDGTIKSYSWAKISGPAATIATPNAVKSTITGLVAGTYTFELTVTDDQNATAKARVKVTVNDINNQQPVADAGSNVTITLPTNSVQVDGAASNDPDGTITAYKWVKISGPAATIAQPDAAASTISGLVAGVYVFELTVTDDKNATASAQITVTVNEANKPPVANAGSNITITLPTNTVQLSGAASNDPDGSIVKYQWTKVSGPAATIATPGAARTAVNGLVAAGTYVFELTVTDDKDATAKARVTVTVKDVNNQLPVADAGNNVTITLPNNTVNVDGTASYDPDGTITAYKWTKVSGAAATIAQPNAATSTISGLVAGVYVFELTVTDNNNSTASAQVTVTVNEVNKPPVANAGNNVTITLPTSTAQLNGTASTGSIVSYKWAKVSGPAATIASPGAARTAINGMVTAGTYVFELTVTDENNASAKARVTVTVKDMPVANDPPLADAGIDRTVNPAQGYVTLDGSASNDPDGSIVKYVWQQVSGTPALQIVSPNKAVTFVTGIVPGTYQFKLTVTDDKGSSASSTVQIVVSEPTDHGAFKIALYPNPATDVIRLNVNKTLTETVNVFIFSATGKLQQTFSFEPGVQIQKQIDISHLAQGIYLLQITNGKNIKEVIKFVKS